METQSSGFCSNKINNDPVPDLDPDPWFKDESYNKKIPEILPRMLPIYYHQPF